jgi:hypothetical protein
MKRIRIIGLAFAVVFAVVAVSSATASAKTCAEATPTTTAPCIVNSEGKPVAKRIITAESKAISTLENNAGTKVTCSSNSATGEAKLSSFKEVENVVAKFKGCKAGAVGCQSGATAEEIVTNKLAGHIAITEPAPSEKVGLDLEPQGTETLFAKFACGAAENQVRGSVIGLLTPVNVSGAKLTLAFEKGEGAGKQKITGVVGDLEDTLEAALLGALFAPAAEETTQTVTFEEPVELRNH